MFLYFLLSKFTFQEISSYEFIKNNRNYFNGLRQSNLFSLAILFILFATLWVFAAGFGSPLALCAGFILSVVWSTIFSYRDDFRSNLIIHFQSFLKEMMYDKFLNRFKNLEENLRNLNFLFNGYRFVGGIPFQIQNILPCMFNVKIYNFFWATLIGLVPQLFLVVSIGSGLEKIIDQNLNAPSMKDLITSPDIYVPLLAFATLIMITVFIRNLFFKK